MSDARIRKANDLADKSERKLSQAEGICDLARLHSEHNEKVADDALAKAMWAACELIDDAKALSHQLSDLARGQAALREVANG